MTCDEVREQLEAYALGALDAAEHEKVQAHLSEDEECAALAREYASIVGAMPDALAAASPKKLPARLKRRVLARLDAGGRGQVASPAPTRPVRNWLTWRTVGIVLAVIVAAFLIAQTAQLSVALAQERALRAEYANLVDQQELVLEVIDSPKTVRAVLRAPSGGPSYGKLFSRPDMPYVVAMIARLPTLPPGQSYHLYLTSQGQTKLAGALNVNAQGFGLIVYQAERNGIVYETAQVILQNNGAAQPSGVPVLMWEATK